nr:hypothetical protein [Tanacetum cinerariifolium]
MKWIEDAYWPGRYPTGITFDYLKSRVLVDIVLCTHRYLIVLHIYYTKEMDLFAFILHSDPTKVRIGERNLADREDSDDSIDKMFDEGNDANQEQSVGKDDDVLEELRDDHQSLPPFTGGKSLFTLRGMVPEGSTIPSDVAELLSLLSDGFRYHIIDVNVATSSKTKDAPKDFEHIGDSESACGVDADAASISKWKVTNDSILDDPYVCPDITDHLLPEKDTEIAHLRSLLSLKEAKAAKDISLRSQLSVVEAADAAKGTELRDLKEKNFALEWENNVLSKKVEALESVVASKEKNSLNSAFELFKEEVEKMQDEQVDVLTKCLSSPEYLSVMGEAICRSIDKGMHDWLAAGIKHGIARRSITDVTAFNPSTESDYIAAINALQEVAHNRDQRLRGDAAARCLFLMDFILPLVEPLSARNLTGEASSPMDFTIVATNTLSTTFVQAHLVPAALSIDVPLCPKVVFEEKELDTTPEHVPAL